MTILPALRRIPGPFVIAASLSAVIGIVAALPPAREPPAHVLAERALHFATARDGTLAITDGKGARVATLPGNVDSFIIGVAHDLAVRRAQFGVPLAMPYTLRALSDGRLLLLDPATRTVIEVEAFGPTNLAGFRALLPRNIEEAAR